MNITSPFSGSEVRVRFAPSPTGFLHIGGVRTALYNWLYAKRNGGKFLLRIEDTDLERSEDRFTQDILASMRWLGLHWDEDPIFQSKRLEEYRAKVESLVERDLAYYCKCSEDDVDAMREKMVAAGQKPMYDRSCREKKLHPDGKDGKREIGNVPAVVRAKVPLSGSVQFTDLIRGEIEVQNSELDDFVLIRSNGAPTYNLSVVVDDVESRMTHIIRGDDHINNTPKQIHLYRAFGYTLPKFAHLPMILGPDKKKLSKRHGAVSANVYRAEGYLPQALLNFLVRLGWSHGDQEEFSVEELCQLFDFDHVQKSSAVFNTEKLLWLNGTHLRKLSLNQFQKIILDDFSDLFTTVSSACFERAKSPMAGRILQLIQPKVKTVLEAASLLVPLCAPGAVEVDSKELKWNKNPELKSTLVPALEEILEKLSTLLEGKGAVSRNPADSAWGSSPTLGEIDFGPAEVEAFIKQVVETRGIKLGDLMQPLRLAVTGRMVSVGVFELLPLLPWDVVKGRILKATKI